MPSGLFCPAVVVSAVASGQGKTTVVAALARAYVRRGLRVQVFKLGPDYIDPMLHTVATGRRVYQLDGWMVGEAEVAQRLQAAAAVSDVIVIEGVMGLFDGSPSTADFAAKYGLPVLAVVGASGMAQTFGAVVQGLAQYRDDVWLYGVCANAVGSDYHARLLRESLPDSVQWLGCLHKDVALALPSRHLGLVPAGEQANVLEQLDALAAKWEETGWAALPPAHDFSALARRVTADGLADEAVVAVSEEVTHQGLLAGQRVAVARDDAFCFLYPANVDVLEEMGAELVFFSPVAGDGLPVCDAVWLPGGYPELHLQALADNGILRDALRKHVAAGKPLLAECGGMLYCLDRLTDKQGESAEMAGLLPGVAVMQPKLAALGLQEVTLPEGVLRGHTFHYAQADVACPVAAQAVNPNRGSGRDAVYRKQRLIASFVHYYFSSNPFAIANLLGRQGRQEGEARMKW